MKLVFFGGEGDSAFGNKDLKKRSIELSKKTYPKVTYIPAFSLGGMAYYKEFVASYKTFGLKQFIYFPIDTYFSDVMLKEAFKSDIIYLSGGNTYYFLKYLRKNKLLRLLRDFVKRGGVLMGLSAGAIIMTPTIHSAGYPEFDKDENDEGVKNLNSLKLVDFEFFPHYKNSQRYSKELLKQSLNREIRIYASPDEHGIVINGEDREFFGRHWAFDNGRKTII